MNTAPRVQVRSAQLFERAVSLRLPFRFGAATVTQAPQAFVRVQVEVDGRSALGASAELMVPKWFDKNPALTHEQNFEQLRQALRCARDAYLGTDGRLTAHGLSLHAGAAATTAAVSQGLPRLAAQFGPAQLDKAVADAVLRSAGLGWCDGLRAGLLGDPFHARLSIGTPQQVALRHTVGLADRITEADPGVDPADGLPATLEAAIRAHGLRYFKIKLCGDAERDLPRLLAITQLLQAQAGDWWATLDGNETFADAQALARHWQALQAESALQPLLQRTLLLEQPIARAQALAQPLTALNLGLPVILDESDDGDEVLARGLALGYSGISSKACKGLYRSLHSASQLAERRVQQPQGRWLLSGEDLTCQAGLAVQQDTLLAASLGVAHIERNGHHYVDGFGTAPAAEAQAFLAAHPGLYHLQQGRVRLRVADGQLDLRSLHGSGFASDALPLWDRLQAIT